MSLLLSAVEPAWFFAGLPFQNCLYLFSCCSSPFGAHTNGTVRANGSTHTATSMQVHLLPGSHSRTCTGWDYTLCSAATGTCTTVATRHALGHQYMKRSHCGTSLCYVNSLLLSTVKQPLLGFKIGAGVQRNTVWNSSLCSTANSRKENRTPRDIYVPCTPGSYLCTTPTLLPQHLTPPLHVFVMLATCHSRIGTTPTALPLYPSVTTFYCQQ